MKKIESDDRKTIAPFVQTQKQKQLLLKIALTMNFNQYIELIYQTYKNL